MPAIKVEIGDVIEVGGYHFVLVELRAEWNKPPKVTFAQPGDLIGEET